MAFCLFSPFVLCYLCISFCQIISLQMIWEPGTGYKLAEERRLMLLPVPLPKFLSTLPRLCPRAGNKRDLIHQTQTDKQYNLTDIAWNAHHHCKFLSGSNRNPSLIFRQSEVTHCHSVLLVRASILGWLRIRQTGTLELCDPHHQTFF